MSKDNYWTNDDGLVVGFGRRTTEDNVAGALNTGGDIEEQLVLDIVATELTDSDEPVNYEQGAKIPANAHIRDAVLVTNEAFTSGGSGVLDIGTVKSDGTFSDDDGIDSAIALGTLTAAAVVDCDGAQVNTVVTEDLWLAATYDTAAFTGGTAKLYVTLVRQ